MSEPAWIAVALSALAWIAVAYFIRPRARVVRSGKGMEDMK